MCCLVTIREADCNKFCLQSRPGTNNVLRGNGTVGPCAQRVLRPREQEVTSLCIELFASLCMRSEGAPDSTIEGAHC